MGSVRAIVLLLHLHRDRVAWASIKNRVYVLSWREATDACACVHAGQRAGTLLAVIDRGMLRFPAWQFDPAGPDGVLAGLPEVIRALGDLPTLSKIGWMVSPKALLPAAPVELLRQGTPTARRDVLRAAEAALRL